jgi:hypothetical protein
MTMNRLSNNSQKKRTDPSLLELCDAIKDIKTNENKKYDSISKVVKDNAMVKNGILLHSEIKETQKIIEDNLQLQKLYNNSNLSYSWDYPKKVIESNEEINTHLIDRMLESANNTTAQHLLKNIIQLGTPSKKCHNSLFLPPKNEKPKTFPLLFQKKRFGILLKNQNKEKKGKMIAKRSKSLNDHDSSFQKTFPITADSLLKTRVIVSPILTFTSPNKKSNDPIDASKIDSRKVLTPIKFKYPKPANNKAKVSNVEIYQKKYYNSGFIVNQNKRLNVWEIFESFLYQTQPMTPSCTPSFPIDVQR